MASNGKGGASAVARPKRTSRTKIAAWVIGGIVLLLGAAYIIAHLAANDSAPRNASVNGVPIGGLSVDEAVAKLTTELEPSDTAPVNLSGADETQTAQIDPVAAGLSVDYLASVHRAGAGASWDPRVLAKVITGGGETEPVLRVDQSAVETTVTGLTSIFTRDAADAKIGLDGTTVVNEPMVTGTELLLEETSNALVDAWRATANLPVTDREPLVVPAVLEVTEPQVTTAEADALATQLSAAINPVLIKTPSAEAEITPEQIASVTTIELAGGVPQAKFDFARLYTEATEVVDKLTVTKPTDARVEMQGGVPVVVPAVDGQSITPEAFTAGLDGVVTQPEPREVALEVEAMPAKFSTADAEALGIKEVVGEFTTYFWHSSYHNTNLGLAAAGINNEMLKPGETFSLAKATGPRNASTGYIAGGVLVGDHIEMIVGGGVSQSATTTYNAAFFAGMTDIEHHPHTQWFSQYPKGREATVYEGVLDLQFRNDTPYGVLMQAYIVPSAPGTQGSITVRVWSTKYFDSVTASEPYVYNYTTGRTQVSTSPNCIAQSPSQGFSVDYQRILVLNGETTVQNYTWRYSPIDKIECKQPEPPEESPAPETPPEGDSGD